MSAASHKRQMHDALRITEGNLSSMIAARFTPGCLSAVQFIETLEDWRDMCRRALGHITEANECICNRCGIRHGGKALTGEGF
jgi:hypothetical protein